MRVMLNRFTCGVCKTSIYAKELDLVVICPKCLLRTMTETRVEEEKKRRKRATYWVRYMYNDYGTMVTTRKGHL